MLTTAYEPTRVKGPIADRGSIDARDVDRSAQLRAERVAFEAAAAALSSTADGWVLSAADMLDSAEVFASLTAEVA